MQALPVINMVLANYTSTPESFRDDPIIISHLDIQTHVIKSLFKGGDDLSNPDLSQQFLEIVLPHNSTESVKSRIRQHSMSSPLYKASSGLTHP